MQLELFEMLETLNESIKKYSMITVIKPKIQ